VGRALHPSEYRRAEYASARESVTGLRPEMRMDSAEDLPRPGSVGCPNAKRPALNELLRDCRRGSVDVVVVWKFDRFARS
jgi:hypothetical protein